jgi:DNA repair protein RecO (recombination protein O)
LPRDYSTEAIVLGSHKLGDADRVVTLFTAGRGKVATVVKGVRKVKSKFGGRLEPFTQLQVQLHEGRNLHTLTGADTVRTHSLLRDTPMALQAGLAFIEMLSRATTDYEQRPRTFNLLAHYLNEMDGMCRRLRDVAEEGDAAATGAGLVFTRITLAAELKLLLLAGFLPHLANCAVCGAGETLPRFSAQVGGALCENCNGESFRVAPATLDAMRQLLEKPLADAAGLAIDDRTVREVWRAVREICRYHLSADLRVEPW